MTTTGFRAVAVSRMGKDSKQAGVPMRTTVTDRPIG
jgi:hypothetical protein